MKGNLTTVIALTICAMFSQVQAEARYRRPMVHYPKGTLFWTEDMFRLGCKTFIQKCPHAYKVQHICGISYNGDFRDFDHYCVMQYENCQTWRNWRVFKRDWC